MDLVADSDFVTTGEQLELPTADVLPIHGHNLGNRVGRESRQLSRWPHRSLVRPKPRTAGYREQQRKAERSSPGRGARALGSAQAA